MRRLAIAVVFLFSTGAVAQNPSSDPFAIRLAQSSVAALVAAATVNDMTLNANVTSIFGGDYETGTATFRGKGINESRVDLNLTGQTRTDVRNSINGVPAGAWEKNGDNSTAYAQHNCWTDAVWFFPALSSLTQTSNLAFIFKYIGQEQHGGVSVQHIAVFQTFKHDSAGWLQGLTVMHFYLDLNSNLPLAAGFRVHPDSDMSYNIPSEVRFANYQSVSGIQIPFHIQSLLNGALSLDITVTNATFNTGLPDSLFTLP